VLRAALEDAGSPATQQRPHLLYPSTALRRPTSSPRRQAAIRRPSRSSRTVQTGFLTREKSFAYLSTTSQMLLTSWDPQSHLQDGSCRQRG